LILYTPIGLILVVIRVFILLQFYLAFIYLPYHPIRKYILRVFSSVLGVVINERHLSKAAGPDSLLWVSNHISPFDRIILQILCCRRTPISFPECGYTNGKKGLLKFHVRVFEQQRRNHRDLKIQPVVLDAHRPFPAVAISCLESSLLSDTFFLLFSPYTSFSVRFLEPTSCQENEDLESYVNRIETTIGEILGIAVTSYTSKDKDELVKRKIADAQMAAHEPTSNNLEVMAAQVKEILPHVPLATIIRDLGRTNSIDVTVANLVEGVVPFVPEPIKTAENAPSSSASSAAPSSSSSSNKSIPCDADASLVIYVWQISSRKVFVSSREEAASHSRGPASLL